MPQHVGVAGGAFAEPPIAAPNLEAACDNRREWLTFYNPLTRLS